MSETIEQLCQRILNARGYLVVSDMLDHAPGTVLRAPTNGHEYGTLTCPLVCIAETNIKDVNAQRAFVGKATRISVEGERHHRVIVE